MAKDYYAVLGVPRNASDQDVRGRFKELAREKHPDRFSGEAKRAAENAFQEITEAFNVLIDHERRRTHDQELAGRSAAGSGRFTGTGAAAARAGGGPVGAADPDKAEIVRAYLARGVQSYKEGNYRAAAESFDRATQADPANPRAWYNLALTCSREGRWLSRAVSAIERACELEPMKVSYRKLAGRLNARAGRAEKAEKHFRQALTWGGEDPEIEEALAELRSGGKRRGLFGGKGT